MGSASPPPSALPQSTDLLSLSSTHSINDSSPLSDEGTFVKPTTKRLKNPAALADKSRNEQAVREAKCEIKSKLREDWEWPFPSSSCILTTCFPPDGDGIEWRERASDSEICSLTEPSDPYKFDTPDAVSPPIVGTKIKRAEMFNDEMTWNEGLRNFVERRDAWTGARTQPTQHPSGTPTSSSGNAQPDGNTISSSTSPSPSTPPERLVPVVPPILAPENIVRASITPQAYPSIYSKIVIQGLAPNIPINLSDMVAAMVQGWKKDGEWPPKGEVERNGIAVMGGGRKLAKRGVGRFKRVLGFVRGDGEEGDERGAA
ncbi:MAG: hypothetical protein Q9217_000124 [Psora testacea]